MLLIEGALFGSARPVIIVPYIQKQGLKLDRIIVCWDGSRPAARAIADALPLLRRAKAIEIVVQTQTASVSLLQRRLRVGYTRAGRLIDMLERRGIISGYEGSKPRRVLVSEADLHAV